MGLYMWQSDDVKLKITNHKPYKICLKKFRSVGHKEIDISYRAINQNHNRNNWNHVPWKMFDLSMTHVKL